MQLLPESLHRGGHGLGGNNDLLPHIVERQPQLFLAVRINMSGVEIIDTALISAAQQLHRLLFVHPLYGQCAEAIFGNNQICASQTYRIHGVTLLFSIPVFIKSQISL